MTGPRAAWRAWVELLDHREDGTSLALVRWLCGGTILAHLVQQRLTGAMALVWYGPAWGGMLPRDPPAVAPEGIAGVYSRFLAGDPAVVDPMWWAATGAALLMTLGVGTRLSVFATWLLFGRFADLNPHAGGSYDALLTNILFLLMLSGAGARLSVDALFASSPRPVPSWPRWLLIFQLPLMYTSTGLQKASDHWVPWGAHDALWYILQQPTWQRAPMWWVEPAYPLLVAGTVAVWCWEVGAPLYLLSFWYRHTRERAGRLRALCNRLDLRALYLAFGFTMHLGIELSLEVGAFFGATMCLYLAAFSPDEYAALGRSLRRLGPRALSETRT